MENKELYFIPDESDFKIGMVYETEELDGCWVKERVENLRELSELAKYNQKYIGKYSEIRVKYLDKKDIKSCGWEQRGDINYFYKTCTQKDKIEFGTQFLVIYRIPVTTPWIFIKAFNPFWTTEEIVYQSRCKSINEFKYITEELLNIK